MEKVPDKIAAYLTHELRSPLQALQFALEVLNKNLEEGASEKNKRVVGAAVCATERLRGCIDDIMEMSRIQMGKTRMVPEACSPGDLAAETASYFEAWADRRWLKLSVSVESGCPQVAADPRRVVQALTNLIANALKYTLPGGSIEVRVRRGQRERAGSVVFTVKDTGCGIPQADLPRVFRYFVSSGSDENGEEGTGLGLPLARSFIELQGGEMWVKSRVGKGSSFYFTLPIHIPADLKIAPPEQARESLHPER